MTFATLSEAIDWARPRWQERPVPLRLTVHDTEGELGGLVFSGPFMRTLNARPNDMEERTEQTACYHMNHPIGVSLFECRDCQGTGMQTVRRWRYRYPMWRAVTRLSRAHNPTPRQPHPAKLVALLASYGWDAPAAAAYSFMTWSLAEPLFLMALRKLHGRYAEGPIDTRRSWVDLSDSQRAAIEAGEAA